MGTGFFTHGAHPITEGTPRSVAELSPGLPVGADAANRKRDAQEEFAETLRMSMGMGPGSRIGRRQGSITESIAEESEQYKHSFEAALKYMPLTHTSHNGPFEKFEVQ